MSQKRKHIVKVERLTYREARKRGAWCLLGIVAGLLLCAALDFLCAPKANAQVSTTNTFNVYSFRNSATNDVGSMTTAAQSQCQSGLTCIIVFDPILGQFPAGIMPAKCASCVWVDYRVPGSYTVTPTNVKVQNGIRYADQFAGTDIGAKINAAYADCPSYGCRIRVSASASGCYSFATPIVLNTVGKAALLEGDPGGASCIEYTPTTGNALTLDWGTSEKQAAGVRDLQLIGPGSASSAVGIQVGSVNGAEISLISGVRFGTSAGLADGFGTGIAFVANSFGSTIEWSMLQNNGTAISISSGIEKLSLDNSIVAQNTTGLNVGAPGADVYVSETSFDDNNTGISVNGGQVECHGCHFENLSVGAAANAYIVTTTNGGEVNLYGGEITDDRTSGTNTQFINLLGGDSNLGIFGTLFNSSGITVTQIATFAGSSRGWLMPHYFSAAIQSDFNQSYAGGPVFDYPTGTGTGVNNIAGFFGTALQFRNGSGFVSGAGGNLYTLSVTNPGSPRTLTLSDPGASASFLFNVGNGFGNGTAGTAMTTTTKNTGTGPATPQTIVKYLEVNVAGVNYWIPLTQ